MTNLLKTPEAAEFLAVEPGTLASWRCRGIGPVYVKLPGLRGGVRYYRSDLEQFLTQHRHVPSVLASLEKIRGL